MIKKNEKERDPDTSACLFLWVFSALIFYRTSLGNIFLLIRCCSCALNYVLICYLLNKPLVSSSYWSLQYKFIFFVYYITKAYTVLRKFCCTEWMSKFFTIRLMSLNEQSDQRTSWIFLQLVLHFKILHYKIDSMWSFWGTEFKKKIWFDSLHFFFAFDFLSQSGLDQKTWIPWLFNFCKFQVKELFLLLKCLYQYSKSQSLFTSF